MNSVINGSRLSLTVFGRPNTGKSAIINALVGSGISGVSHTAGTTMRPMHLDAEIPTVGAVHIIDTPGLCASNIPRCKQFGMIDGILGQTGIALLVMDVNDADLSEMEHHLIRSLSHRGIPYVFVWNKIDTVERFEANGHHYDAPSIGVSTVTGDGIAALRDMIHDRRPDAGEHLIGDLIGTGRPVLIVTRNDSGDQRNRMRPVYEGMIRESLDAGCLPLMTRESDLPVAMTTLIREPALVVADTDNFDRVARMIPSDIPLTTLSLLMARRKGNLREFISSMSVLTRLKPGNRVLIAEACEYRPISEQEQYLELPRILRTMTGGPLKIDTVSGPIAFPDRLRGYSLVIHCAACGLSRREMLRRQALAKKDGVPLIHLAVFQTYIGHALPRALSPLRQNGALSTEADALADSQDLRITA